MVEGHEQLQFSCRFPQLTESGTTNMDSTGSEPVVRLERVSQHYGKVEN